MKRFFLFFLAAACVLSLSACGGKADEPDLPDDFDTTFTGPPTSWEQSGQDDPAKNPTGLYDGSAGRRPDGQGTDPSQEPAGPTDAPMTPEPAEPSEPVDQPGQEGGEAKPVPSVAELKAMTDAEASMAVRGTLQANLIRAWGNPDKSFYVEEVKNYDTWTFRLEDGQNEVVYVYYEYSTGLGRAVEFCHRGSNTWKEEFWGEEGLVGFRTWLCDSQDYVKVLSKLYGLTRYTIRELIGSTCGWISDVDGNFLGDVFDVNNPTSGTSNFLYMIYDDDQRCIPVNVRFYAHVDEANERLDKPVLEDGLVYHEGIWNTYTIDG